MRPGDKVFVAFDLGASGWRAALGRCRQGKIEIDEICHRPNAPVERDGGLFWDVEAIYDGILGVLTDLRERGIAPAAIGLDSWSVDYGLLDKNGELLELPRCYRDPRNQGMLEAIQREITVDELFRRTGVMCEDFTTLCQLRAARTHTPRLLDEARRLLFVPDLLRYWLCGEPATDFPLAVASQMYNIGRADWDVDLLSRLDVPSRIMPRISCGLQVLGCLCPDVRRKTGLGCVPVVTGASHDTTAAFAAAAADPDCAVLSSGTWSIVGANVGHNVFYDGIDPLRFGYEGNHDGSFRLVHNIPGMWILEQCRAQWAAKGIDTSYEKLIDDALPVVGSGAVIDPYWQGFVSPADMTQAVMDFCRETAQAVPGSPGEFVAAIVQGLAQSYASAISELRTITGRRLDKLCIVGGGSRNHLLNYLTAKAARVSMVVGPVEASMVGNVLAQAMVTDPNGYFATA